MLEMLRNEANQTLTENGAVTYATTGSDCLDLFATIGGLRNADNNEVINRFIRAYTENPDNAMKILFYSRDVRGGLGERRVFRIIMNWLGDNAPQSVIKNLAYVSEYGRYDDLLTLFGTPCEEKAAMLIKKQLKQDIEDYHHDKEISLLAKWLPSVNASSKETVKPAKRLIKYLGMGEREYRTTLSALRQKIRIIENNLREKDYTFDYSKQPSKAMYKYRKAFLRNDGERYRAYLKDVNDGVKKINTSVLMPYELIQPYLSYGGLKEITEDEKNILNTTWNNLPDYGNDENMLAVIDTSGSMYMISNSIPAAVAFSLGLYFAERNKGVFANAFIEFSKKPCLIELKGNSFYEKLRYAASFCQVANTNLEAVFTLILKTAVKNKVAQSELPSKLVIISDMEFDRCIDNGSLTNFENAKKMFAEFGYKLPDVVFWNVASRNSNQPVRQNEQGAALVSGCTPKLFEMIAGGIVSPIVFMNEVLNSERYKPIKA